MAKTLKQKKSKPSSPRNSGNEHGPHTRIPDVKRTADGTIEENIEEAAP